MPSKYRLSRADFQHTRTFKRVNGSLFTLLFGTLSGRERPGGACVISKKVARTAVARNRVKRRVRVEILPFLTKAKTPIIVVFLAKKGAVEAKASELRAEIDSLLAKIH